MRRSRSTTTIPCSRHVRHRRGAGWVSEAAGLDQLIAGVRKLEQAGSECIVIPCMTVHYFYHDMQKAVRIPILHMVEEIVKRVQAARITKVGLLTSESSQRLRLYESALHAHGIQALHVSQTQQQALNEIIFQVMKGVQGPLDTACLKSVIADLCAQGAESIIIGCTELPLAITQKDVAVPLLDSLQIMAEVSLSHSLKN